MVEEELPSQLLAVDHFLVVVHSLVVVAHSLEVVELYLELILVVELLFSITLFEVVLSYLEASLHLLLAQEELISKLVVQVELRVLMAVAEDYLPKVEGLRLVAEEVVVEQLN